MYKLKQVFLQAQALSVVVAVGLGCGSSPSKGNSVSDNQATSQLEIVETPKERTAEELRALGPEGLIIALASYDQSSAEDRSAQAHRVDAVAGQRYATTSRLYWYTDLAKAKTASKDSGRPILSLRLLGRLDEDFSCANSRLFRTVLYANEEVSAFLRDNFTLHWSSERVVPKITIDFGDGRIMKSTIAGNSAHYVLTSDGRPIDVVPGLYSPKAFISALTPALALAGVIGKGVDADASLRAYHESRVATELQVFGKRTAAQRTALEPYRIRQIGRDILTAELLTLGKSFVEVPLVSAMGIAESGGIGQVLDAGAVRDSVTATETLDGQSRALIVEIGPTDWGVDPDQLRGPALNSMLLGLERRIAGDTLINQHGLHVLIHQIFIRDAKQNFAALNKEIYSDIFVTPITDPWLGMAQPQGFSGLPGDGLLVP